MGYKQLQASTGVPERGQGYHRGGPRGGGGGNGRGNKGYHNYFYHDGGLGGSEYQHYYTDYEVYDQPQY